MAGFHDDDLEDYEQYSDGEEFNEDNLDDEEYEKLYAQLPLLKKALADYNDDIQEIDLKEALYFNYYKLEDSVNELKEKYPRKKKVIIPPPSPISEKPSPVPEKPLSKLAQLAQKRKLEKEQQQQQPEGAQQQQLREQKPASKLSQLAKSRSTTQAQNSTKSISILDGLRKKVPSDDSVSALKPASKILSLGKTSGDPRRLLKRKAPESLSDKSEAILQDRAESPLLGQKGGSLSPLDDVSNSIPFDVVFDDSNLLKIAKSSLSEFLFHEEIQGNVETNKRRRLSRFKDIFEPLTNHEVNVNTAKKIKDNFSEPSPDQKVLDAQKAAFEDNMSGLSLSEAAAKQKQEQSQSQPKAQASLVKTTKPFKKIDLDSILKTHKDYLKPRKSFVVIGHVDAGKSTLLGRILYDVGAVDAKQLNKLTREAEKAGKGSFALAWIMDQTTEERSRGVTVDICATSFETSKSKFTAIDAPGHKDFVPQMISGVTQARYAVLVVDSINGEFESGFNMDGQTKEHTLLARYLGIEKVIVVVNKMDKEDWSQQRFQEITQQLTEFLTNADDDVCFSEDQLEFIPLSGLTGNNLVKRDNGICEFKWYTGPTLLEYLDQLDDDVQENAKKSAEQLQSEDFNLTVNDVFEATSSEFIITGKVSSGVIQAGETILISPSNEHPQVQSITVHERPVDFAMTGEVASLRFKTNQLVNKVTSITAGDMVLKTNSSVQSSDKFVCEIKLFQIQKPLLVGTPFVLFRNNCHSQARITKIIDIVEQDGDKEAKKKKKKKMHLVSKQVAIVEIQSDRVFPISTYTQNEILGRVVLRREGFTIGAGKVTDTESESK